MSTASNSNSEAAFEGFVRPRVVFGAGAVARIDAVAAEFQPRSILLVTDPGIVAAGHVERVMEALRKLAVRVSVFDQVRENPDGELVDQCAKLAASVGADLLVGLGGGSSLDTSKGCNFVVTNGGTMQDYWGYGKAVKPLLPLIAIPTTAGTGSENSNPYALISDSKTHQKMACGDPKAAARVAILDPELTVSMPRIVTARTGLDTVTHAVETAVTLKRNAFSSLFSREAFRLAHANLPRVLDDPGDLLARGSMLLASAYAGVAIETSMLGAAHSLANPLTARFDLVHGQAVGMMLPNVVSYNAEDAAAAAIYADLAHVGGLADDSTSVVTAVHRLVNRLRFLLRKCDMPDSLRACGIDESHLDDLSAEAARQWTAQFNPRKVGAPELRALYASSLT